MNLVYVMSFVRPLQVGNSVVWPCPATTAGEFRPILTKQWSILLSVVDERRGILTMPRERKENFVGQLIGGVKNIMDLQWWHRNSNRTYSMLLLPRRADLRLAYYI